MAVISVLIPIYNVKKYLPQCLDSVLNQTFSDFEAICIDDGSTDGCAEILDGYARRDSRIRVIHKQNEGYGKSMNRGLGEATGEYISIVESDDVMEPDMLENMYGDAVRYDLDVAKYDYSMLTGIDDLQHRTAYPGVSYGTVFMPSQSHHEFNILMREPASIWSALYRRSFLEEHRIRFHETPGASFQDVSFQFQTLFHAKKYRLSNTAVYRYRVDNAGSSVRSSKKLYCIFDEFDFVKDYAEKNGNPELYRSILSAKYFHLLGNYGRVDDLYKYTVLERIIRELELDQLTEANLGLEWDEKTRTSVAEIMNSPDRFFEHTNLDFMERIIYPQYTSNKDCVMDAIRYYSNQGRRLYIYGAGVRGKRLSDQLRQEQIEITGFAVTEKKDNAEAYEGLSIWGIDEIKNEGEPVFLVSMLKEKQLPVLQLLQEKGFKMVISM